MLWRIVEGRNSFLSKQECCVNCASHHFVNIVQTLLFLIKIFRLSSGIFYDLISFQWEGFFLKHCDFIRNNARGIEKEKKLIEIENDRMSVT